LRSEMWSQGLRMIWSWPLWRTIILWNLSERLVIP
jgi:hypothetical protein